LGWFTLV